MGEASDREAVVAGAMTLLFALAGHQPAARVVGASIPTTGPSRERVAGVALLVPLACGGPLVFEAINRLFLAG